jgi:hypothetical protein
VTKKNKNFQKKILGQLVFVLLTEYEFGRVNKDGEKGNLGRKLIGIKSKRKQRSQSTAKVSLVKHARKPV